VGLGPGSVEHLTHKAKRALSLSEVVVGYESYVKLIDPLLGGKEVICTAMGSEVSRAEKAITLAEGGKIVSLVSSGDSGIYGMAGLVYQILQQRGWQVTCGLEVEVVPGVALINAAAALLGAPLMHDFVVISLSDLLTPWRAITKRLELAAQGDFVIVIYNPKSQERWWQIIEAQQILSRYKSNFTPVGMVSSAYRQGQQIIVTDLEHMLDFEIGMLTTIIVGNSTTFTFEGRIITPRGYQI
jgi:precorrin-3B C17-methyltransferase